ncbi:hypothetical protein HanRHA438_Chr15g0687621 [Helianthus annuus]|nr:hypothetical protein HanRHA438_Chr15g0687621 [Helianthus annuus]
MLSKIITAIKNWGELITGNLKITENPDRKKPDTQTDLNLLRWSLVLVSNKNRVWF